MHSAYDFFHHFVFLLFYISTLFLLLLILWCGLPFFPLIPSRADNNHVKQCVYHLAHEECYDKRKRQEKSGENAAFTDKADADMHP